MHLGWQTGENKWALTAPNRWGAPVNTPVQIGTGWQNFRDIFGTTDGTIFAVTPEGTLLMYQHKGFETGADSWTGPVNAGTGWKSYLQAFTIMPENIPDAPH